MAESNVSKIQSLKNKPGGAVTLQEQARASLKQRPFVDVILQGLLQNKRAIVHLCSQLSSFVLPGIERDVGDVQRGKVIIPGLG